MLQAAGVYEQLPLAAMIPTVDMGRPLTLIFTAQSACLLGQQVHYPQQAPTYPTENSAQALGEDSLVRSAGMTIEDFGSGGSGALEVRDIPLLTWANARNSEAREDLDRLRILEDTVISCWPF